jgi:hypothetical protein
MLRKNYDIQVHSSTSLREELRSKEEQFRQKITVLETELKRFMQENSSRVSEAQQEELSRLQANFDAKLQRFRVEITERD